MEPTISIHNLQKNYGSKVVLDGINLDVYKGQVIGYIGPNGAGKSTTVKILTGLIADFTGTVTVNGIDISANPLAVKSMIGYVPELAELYDTLTPAEFLHFVAALYGIDQETATDRMTRMMDAFGLADYLNERIETFSKGMKQKVLLISGLIHNPDIVILDEPLSGLDANSVILVKDLISKLAAEGKTIFYCSHMMDIVEKISDRIILINSGTIVADGTFEELKSQSGNQSLERIFAGLTAGGGYDDSADHLIDAIR